jgi:hypothetical protein
MDENTGHGHTRTGSTGSAGTSGSSAAATDPGDGSACESPYPVLQNIYTIHSQHILVYQPGDEIEIERPGEAPLIYIARKYIGGGNSGRVYLVSEYPRSHVLQL